MKDWLGSGCLVSDDGLLVDRVASPLLLVLSKHLQQPSVFKTRVRILASCQILDIKYKKTGRSKGPWDYLKLFC